MRRRDNRVYRDSFRFSELLGPLSFPATDGNCVNKVRGPEFPGYGSFAMTSIETSLTEAYLRTPRAAAFAGIIFSVLLVAVFGLMRLSCPLILSSRAPGLQRIRGTWLWQ